MIRLMMVVAFVAVMAAGHVRAQAPPEDEGIATLGGQLLDDPRCVKLCVALIQAIGDDVKEQIYLTCDQISGVCEGTGHLSLTDQRVPVSVNSTLEGDELRLRIDGPQGTIFRTDEGETLSMEIGRYMPWQVGQFVVQPAAPDGRVSDERPLVVTILVEKLVTPSSDPDTNADADSSQP